MQAAQADGLALDGSVAFSDRGLGFLTAPYSRTALMTPPLAPFPPRSQNRARLTWASSWTWSRDLEQPPRRRRSPTVQQYCWTRQRHPDFCRKRPLYKNGRLVGAIGIAGWHRSGRPGGGRGQRGFRSTTGNTLRSRRGTGGPVAVCALAARSGTVRGESEVDCFLNSRPLAKVG